jgi:hypothetical protein
MTRVGIIIFFLLCSFRMKSQTIVWVLNLNEKHEYKGGKPKKIIDSTAYNISTNVQKTTTIKYFDDAGLLSYSEYEHITGGYTVITKYLYDTLSHRVLAHHIEHKGHPASNRSSINFEYDEKQHVKRIVHKDSAERITQITNMLSNEKGHPVQLVQIDSNGVQFWKEIAVYDYAKNRVHITAYSANGNVAFANSFPISFKDASKFPDDKGEYKYNEHGEVIAYPGKMNGVAANFEVDRIYDKRGYPVVYKIYEVITPNGKKERVLVTVNKLEYFY